jgi:exodeoxyribonuclease-1
MSNFLIYDLETSDSALNFSQILEASFIICDENLVELDRATFHARLSKTFIPNPGALMTNQVSVKRLKETNLSEYEMLKQIISFLNRCGKYTSMGWNSSNFDRQICRASFWRSLEKPYIFNTEGNTEADLLHTCRSSHLFFPNSIKTGTTSKGNPEFKLTSISEANNLKHEFQHTAESDCEATLATARILKEKANSVWKSSLKTTSKKEVLSLLEEELMVISTENYGGGPKPHLVTYLVQHPVYTYPLCFDLRNDVDFYLNLTLKDLKSEISKTPKPIRTVKHSAHPILMNPSYINNFEVYAKIGMDKLIERAKKIKKNKQLAEKISILKKDEVEEKSQSNQLDKYVEETIYSGKFPGPKDNIALKKFSQTNTWEERAKLKDTFEDERYNYFLSKLLYENQPNLLSKSELNKIHGFLAENFLTTEKKPFTTIPSAFKAVDDFRNKYDGNEKKMKQIEEINLYIEELKNHYESA